MDYAALKAEIAMPAYAKMTDAQIAVALIAQTVAVKVDVPVSAVEGYMLTRGIIAAADAWAAVNQADTSGVLSAIRSLEGLMASPRIQTVQMTDAPTAAAVQQMLGAMALAEIITAEQMAEVLAMATSHTSRAAQLGFDPATHDMVQEIAAARNF